MAHQLSIRLDADVDNTLLPSFSSGNLLHGEVTFMPESDVYLNSITVMLARSIAPQTVPPSAGDEDEFELVTRGLFGWGDELTTPSRKDLLALKFDAGDWKVVDQRKISSEFVPGFVNALTAASTHSWRFAFPLPNEPWSYTGRLFRIRWYVEGKADIGRGPARIINPFRRLPEAVMEFTLLSSQPK